jgi:two-component system KDP operon response regulator KdpE
MRAVAGNFHKAMVGRLSQPVTDMIEDNHKKKCVLVVDDQPRIIKFMAIFLKLKGFDVISATSGLRALDLAGSESPDIILLDIGLPDMNGFEVMKRLRRFSEVPVIAVSGSPGSHYDADDMGADDFIIKPFQTDEILERINRLLEHQAG